MNSLQQSHQVSRQDAAIELIRRRAARSNLQDFILFINPDYIVSDFSREVCSELDQFLIDVMDGVRPILILGAPPQHGKSDIVSRYLPAYILGNFPDLRLGGLSYGKDLASDMNRDVQRIMMSEEYAILFPESCLNKKRVVASIDVEAKRNSETFEIVGRKGSYVGQGVGGPLTGKKLDIGIIDDPIKNAKEALSLTTKNSIWNWYASTFTTRLSKNSGQIIMATRWATDDLSGRVIDSKPSAKVLQFAAINDDGEALIPELHPIEKLIETRDLVGEYFWSAMYQQTPFVQGGGIFKNEWVKHWCVLPVLEYRMIYADTAMKTGQENDFSVFQHWGKGKDGKIYMLDMIRGKWEAPQLLSQARAFWDKCKNSNTGVLRKLKIEDKASGTGLIQQLNQSGVPVSGIQRSIDKTVRGYDASPQIEAGNVYFMESNPHLSDLLQELALFPKASHDDTIDPMMDAIQDMLTSGKQNDYGKLL